MVYGWDYQREQLLLFKNETTQVRFNRDSGTVQELPNQIESGRNLSEWQIVVSDKDSDVMARAAVVGANHVESGTEAKSTIVSVARLLKFGRKWTEPALDLYVHPANGGQVYHSQIKIPSTLMGNYFKFIPGSLKMEVSGSCAETCLQSVVISLSVAGRKSDDHQIEVPLRSAIFSMIVDGLTGVVTARSEIELDKGVASLLIVPTLVKSGSLGMTRRTVALTADTFNFAAQRMGYDLGLKVFDQFLTELVASMPEMLENSLTSRVINSWIVPNYNDEGLSINKKGEVEVGFKYQGFHDYYYIREVVAIP